MSYFDKIVAGACLVCSGHSQGTCYCQQELSSAHHYQNSQAQSVEVIQPQNKNPQLPEEQSVREEETKAKGTYQRAKKDNVAYKLFNANLKKIFCRLTGRDLDKNYLDLYCRKEYFLIVLSQLEREHKCEEAQKLFVQEMIPFMERLQNKHQSQPEYIQFLRKLSKDHLKAFSEFNSGQIQQSLKTIFDFNNMRHKAKFSNALNSVEKIRKEMGLSF